MEDEEVLRDKVTYCIGKASAFLPEHINEELWEAWMIYSRNVEVTFTKKAEE